MNFDFNGDTVMPEQDNLFDDLLEDLAFESELGNFDGNFLDFDFGSGLLDTGEDSMKLFDGVTLPNDRATASQSLPQSQQAVQQQPQEPPQYVFNFGGDIIAQLPASHSGSNTTALQKRKKASESSATKTSKKGPDTALPPAASQFIPPPNNPVVSLLSSVKINSLTQLPVTLLKAFNGGDIQKVREIIRDATTKTCALKTPALDTEIFGQNYIADFFESVYESHPDTVWVAKKSKYIAERCEVSSRIYFAGTRIAQATKGTDLSGAYAEYLFKRRGSSLLDEMDVSALTEPEVVAMKELENLGCNLSVFGKGTMTLLVDEESGKITKFSVMWVITSFRQATI